MSVRKNIAVCLLALIMLISMAGCKSESTANMAEKPAETAPAETAAVVISAKPTDKHVINLYVSAPGDWEEVHVWAWKDGGETVEDAWLGMKYNEKSTYFNEVLPKWVDRVEISCMEKNIYTGELSFEPGYNIWIVIDEQETKIYYEDPHVVVPRTTPKDPFYLAAKQGDFETMKSMLADIEDRSILTDWAYNDFNYEYAVDAIRAGDYETAIEFFGYCASDLDRIYAEVIEILVTGEWENALDVIKSREYDSLERDLEMCWGEIIREIAGITKDFSELDQMLMDNYVAQYLKVREPSFKEEQLLFGDSSYWMSESYVGEITDEDYLSVSNFNKLKSQCGSKANGKVLIIRSQMSYPKGKTYYAIDFPNMENLSADLYPASLSEVEYIIVENYGYTVDGKYRQTLTFGDNSVADDFAFLRMKGQVQLLNVSDGKTVQTSPWIEGTGEVDAHFSELNYQCSNMPETGAHIISAVEEVRRLNGQ